MSKIYIGIDIGADGAIAILEGEWLSYRKFPKTEDRPDIAAFASIMMQYSSTDCHIVIEDLKSIFGASASSNFSFGWINGATEAVLMTMMMSYSKILPKKWQKNIWEGIKPVEILAKGKKNKDGSPKYKTDTKATSLLAAKRLFPKESFLATERSKVPHNGIVDACLLALYGKRMNL